MSDTHLQLDRLLEVGRYRELRQLLQSAFADNPHDPELYCFAARAALGEDDLEAAQDHVEQALRADPAHLQARLLLFALALGQKRFSEAEGLITALIRERPYDADLITLYAQLMLTTLHLEKARALVQEALRREPDNERARLLDVLLLTVEGRRGAAGDQLEQLIREDPEGAEVARTLFTVLVEQRRHHEALEIGRQLLRLDPNDPELVEALAELRCQTHWIALPAYPMRRFGWSASAALWALGAVGVRAVGKVNLVWGGSLAALYLLYVIYSWVYPPLLKRWLLRRGF